MAADRMPNERPFNSHMPSHNHGFGRGRGRGRNWNQGRGSRRIGHWEPAQGAWFPDHNSQPRDPQSTVLTSSPATLSDGRPPLLPTPQGRFSNTQRSEVICFRCDK